MTTKVGVIVNETPVCDQPVVVTIGCRNTASENMVPAATQPMAPPVATMTH